MEYNPGFAEYLADEVHAICTPQFRSGKGELIEYYKGKYGTREKGGKVPWKEAIIRDLMPITGLKHKSLEKRFESRAGGTKVTKKSSMQYAELGRTKTPQQGWNPPPGGFVIHFVGYPYISGRCTNRPREFTAHITGAAAYEFANASPDEMELIMYSYYFYDEDTAEGTCDAEIDVYPGRAGTEDTKKTRKKKVIKKKGKKEVVIR